MLIDRPRAGVRSKVGAAPASLRSHRTTAACPSAIDSFAASRSGVAALEFAFIAPFLILLMFSGFELSRYIKANRQLTVATNTLAGMIAQNTSGSINDTDLLFFRDSIMISYPDVLRNSFSTGTSWLNDLQVTMSSVKFTASPSGCTSNCSYKAKVAWTEGSNPRPCSVYLTSAPNNASPSTTTLPVDSFGPGSLIVVDLQYRYKPIVASNVFGPLNITSSFYTQPRYVSSIAYAQNAPALATVCASS